MATSKNPIVSIFDRLLRKRGWDFTCPRRGKVYAQDGDGALTIILDDSKDLEPLKRVPLALGLPGVSVIIQQGAIVLVSWINRDPTQPVAFLVSGAATLLSLDANTINLGPNAAAVNLGQATTPVTTLGAPVQVTLPAGTGTVTGTLQTVVKA